MSVANVLAIAAIVMSAVSLSWHVVSWLRSGAVVKAWITDNHDSITVNVYNSGRTAATVTEVGVYTALVTDPQVDPTPLPGSDSISHRIEAGDHGSWNYRLEYRGGKPYSGIRPMPYYNPKNVKNPRKGWVYATVIVGEKKVVYASKKVSEF